MSTPVAERGKLERETATSVGPKKVATPEMISTVRKRNAEKQRELNVREKVARVIDPAFREKERAEIEKLLDSTY